MTEQQKESQKKYRMNNREKIKKGTKVEVQEELFRG